MIFNQTLVRLRPRQTENGRGDLVEDWTTPHEHPIEGLSIQPAQQQETEDETRTATVTGWNVQSAAGIDLDIVASDRVRHDGVTCRVVGEVARWPDPFTGGVHHVEFVIERRTG